MLGLRTCQGVPKELINFSNALPYLQQGLLVEKDNRIVATTQGYYILNRIIEDLIRKKKTLPLRRRTRHLRRSLLLGFGALLVQDSRLSFWFFG